MRIHIHSPDSLNEFPTFARISLDDAINFIQHACERTPLIRIDCEPIKINPCFSDFFRALFIKHCLDLKLVEP